VKIWPVPNIVFVFYSALNNGQNALQCNPLICIGAVQTSCMRSSGVC